MLQRINLRINLYKLGLGAVLLLIFCLTVANLFVFYVLSLVIKVAEAL